VNRKAFFRIPTTSRAKIKANNFNLVYPLLNTNITDVTKINSNYETSNEFNTVSIPGRSNLDLRVIYNMSTGFSYSFAPSIKIIKK